MTYRHTVVKQKKITSRRRNYGIVKRQANTEQYATKEIPEKDRGAKFFGKDERP